MLDRGAKTLWAGLWLVMSWLWLGAVELSQRHRDALTSLRPGMGWLSSVQTGLAKGAGQRADRSRSCSRCVRCDCRWVSRPIGGRGRFALAIALNLLYWVLGQGFGGIFAGGATDPNAGPLFILLAVAMFPLVGVGERAPARVQEPTPTPAVLGGSLKPRSA